jgi:DNA-binding beta-propeller fold protein YncE
MRQRISFLFWGSLLRIIVGTSLLGLARVYPLFAAESSAGTQSSTNLIKAATIKIPNPIDVKWTASGNLYVLSGATATITEFNASGTCLRSLSKIGENPSSFDVDASGNVYVAMAGDNQVWKFVQTKDSFTADTNFGVNGYIGAFGGDAGHAAGQFKAPSGVALSLDGKVVSVVDSGNNRIQNFTIEGRYIQSFEKEFDNIGRLKGPRGLAYDPWNNFVMVDAGNNRIVVASDFGLQKASGETGAGPVQFKAPGNLCVTKRGVYVADTGNDRILIFNPIPSWVFNRQWSLVSRLTIGPELGLKHPRGVVATKQLLEENLYIADTGNDRVLFVKLPSDNPEKVWKSMTSRLAAGDVTGAIVFFSRESKARYRQMYGSLSRAELAADAAKIANITPQRLSAEEAEYYFYDTESGQKDAFPVSFIKEDGEWKIVEY